MLFKDIINFDLQNILTSQNSLKRTGNAHQTCSVANSALKWKLQQPTLYTRLLFSFIFIINFTQKSYFRQTKSLFSNTCLRIKKLCPLCWPYFRSKLLYYVAVYRACLQITCNNLTSCRWRRHFGWLTANICDNIS